MVPIGHPCIQAYGSVRELMVKETSPEGWWLFDRDRTPRRLACAEYLVERNERWKRE
jgi:hypothetical protein